MTEALNSEQIVHESLWLRGLLTTEQITPSHTHGPLEDYPITIRHIEYQPPDTTPITIVPQPSLNQFLRLHLPKPKPIETLDTPPTYNPPETEITKYFDYLNTLNKVDTNAEQEPAQEEIGITFPTDLEQQHNQARSSTDPALIVTQTDTPLPAPIVTQTDTPLIHLG